MATPNPAPMPYMTCGRFKIAPFQDPDVPPYGSMANTTKSWDYPIPQTGISLPEGGVRNYNWPSSEHMYHAQKLLFLKASLPPNDPMQRYLTGALDELSQTKAVPGDEIGPEDFQKIATRLVATSNWMKQRGIRTQGVGGSVDQFNNLAGGQINPRTGESYTVGFMRDTIKAKSDHNPQFKQLLTRCAELGIIPVETTGRKDYKWAAGRRGTGDNMLGILCLEQGNQNLRAEGRGNAIAIPNVRAAYQDLRQYAASQPAHPLANRSLSGTGPVSRLNNPDSWNGQPVIAHPQARQRPMSRVPTLPPRTNVSKRSIFQVAEHDAPDLNQVAAALNDGYVLRAKGSAATWLDQYIKAGREPANVHAAQLLTGYAVKNIMSGQAVPTNVEIVRNINASLSGQDPHALRIQFKTPEEAAAFSKSLYDKCGIYSATAGQQLKTVQAGNSIYLTKADLEKISQAANLTTQPDSGTKGFEVMASAFARAVTEGVRAGLSRARGDDATDDRDTTSHLS